MPAAVSASAKPPTCTHCCFRAAFRHLYLYAQPANPPSDTTTVRRGVRNAVMSSGLRTGFLHARLADCRRHRHLGVRGPRAARNKNSGMRYGARRRASGEEVALGVCSLARKPSTLSGSGRRRRVAIARALVGTNRAACVIGTG